MRSPIFVLLLMSVPALANTSSHSGGGGGSSPTCIRWEPIPYDLGTRDMALVGSGSDGGSSDGGASLDMGGHVGMRCAEYASLFSCAMSGGARDDGGAALSIFGLVFVAILVRRRHRA
jgi:hypothetical protein